MDNLLRWYRGSVVRRQEVARRRVVHRLADHRLADRRLEVQQRGVGQLRESSLLGPWLLGPARHLWLDRVEDRQGTLGRLDRVSYRGAEVECNRYLRSLRKLSWTRARRQSRQRFDLVLSSM